MLLKNYITIQSQDPDSKVHVANMAPIWVRQDPGGPNVDPMNLTIWGALVNCISAYYISLFTLDNTDLSYLCL